MENRNHRGRHRARTVVASSQVVNVETCGCGVMHLHFGPLSMRFTEESLQMLHQTIGEALRHQEREHEEHAQRARHDGAPLLGTTHVRGQA